MTTHQEFLQVVLQRGTCEQQAPLRDILKQCFITLRLHVLQLMSFIEHGSLGSIPSVLVISQDVTLVPTFHFTLRRNRRSVAFRWSTEYDVSKTSQPAPVWLVLACESLICPRRNFRSSCDPIYVTTDMHGANRANSRNQLSTVEGLLAKSDYRFARIL